MLTAAAIMLPGTLAPDVPGSISPARIDAALATLSSTGSDLVVVQPQVVELTSSSEGVPVQMIQSSPLVVPTNWRSMICEVVVECE